jgi:integrase
MPSGLISKRSVDAFSPARQEVLWDERDKGFGLLALPSGAKSYVFQFRIGGRSGKLRRYTIGRHGEWTPDQARKRAQELRAQVVRGIDPIETERNARAEKALADAQALEATRLLNELDFTNYVDTFVARGIRPDTRPRTKEVYAQSLRNHAAPGLVGKALPDITKADILRMLDKLPADQPAVRRNAFAVLRILFNWAVDRGDITSSPMAMMKAPVSAVSRDRVLSDEEVALILRATEKVGKPFGPFYRLLFLTGQRRDECSGIDWSELDRATATWLLPGSRTKNGIPHVVPLAPAAVALFDGLSGKTGKDEPKWPKRGLVFSTNGETPISGYSRAKTRLDKHVFEISAEEAAVRGDDPIVVVPWRIHDARRTMATGFQRMGVRFEVTEAVLNHTSGASRSGVAAVYQRHEWTDEKRQALSAWANHLEQLLHPVDDAKVVSIGKRKA